MEGIFDLDEALTPFFQEASAQAPVHLCHDQEPPTSKTLSHQTSLSPLPADPHRLSQGKVERKTFRYHLEAAKAETERKTPQGFFPQTPRECPQRKAIEAG
jgi:hypothetical protein